VEGQERRVPPEKTFTIHPETAIIAMNMGMLRGLILSLAEHE